MRIRYAKRGRLRFTSHRDFARAFERALRRAAVPMAYSAGFSPHPRISYLGAAPTGVASEAEYLELGLAQRVVLSQLAAALDAALPAGLDILDCVEARPGGSALADRIDAAAWQVELPGVPAATLGPAVQAFLARESVLVERLTKDGRRTVDARAAIVSATVRPVSGATRAEPAGPDTAGPVAGVAGETGRERAGAAGAGPEPLARGDFGPGASAGSTDRDCAILDVVVRQATPAVRPDDVLAALRVVADLVPPVPVRAIRLAQGRLDDTGRLADPLAPDREAAPPTANHAAARESPPGSGRHQAPSFGTAAG